jgi:hypothetical protein
MKRTEGNSGAVVLDEMKTRLFTGTGLHYS